MKNFIRICLISIFVLFIASINIFAVDINMDISDNDIEENFTDDTIDIIENVEDFESLTSNDPTLSTYVEDEEPVYKMSTTTTSTDTGLTVSDIIDIILISVGIVIILLAIAILIRLKH